jgi:hypothetical protein
MLFIRLLLLIWLTIGPISSFNHPPNRVSGLLFLEPNRNDSDFDLFYPCVLDSTKNLEQNIRSLKKGVAIHIVALNSKNFEDLIVRAKKLRNQSVGADFDYSLKFVLVVPIYAEIDFKRSDPVSQEGKLFSYKMTLFNNTLFDKYQNRILFLYSSSIINLPA